MKLSQWLSPLPLLSTALLPDASYAASCSPSGYGSDFIGIEFVANAGPNSDGEYRYQSSNLTCNDDNEVTWTTWPYPIDLGWHHPDTFHETLPPAGFRTNHRVFINACGTRMVGVNERYSGLLDKIDMSLANVPLQQASYDDRFAQPLYLAYGAGIAACPVPATSTDEYLGSNSDCAQPMVADSVNAASGNNYYREEDINAGDLTFTRSYNSRSDNAGALGPNWQHNFEQRLSVAGDSITAQRPDGRVVTFAPAGPNNWRSAQDPSALIRPRENTPREYTYTDRSGIVEQYDGDGRWQTTRDHRGNVIAGVYRNNRLSRIIDQFDNALELEYGADGKLSKVIAPGQRAFSYSYHDSGLLAATTRPDESRRGYHYDDDNRASHLISIVNAEGQTLSSWRYDAQHRVAALFHGDDSGTLETNARNYSLAYTAASTQVTNPLGKQTIYHFTDVANSKRVHSVEGLSSAHCVSANRAYAYHPNGLLQSKTNSHGITTRYSYNDRGLISQRREADGLVEQRLVATTWHPSLNKPVLIDEGSRQTTYHYDDAGRVLNKTISDQTAHQSPAQHWTYRYNDLGRLVAIDGPRHDVADSWHFDYDPAGYLRQFSNPLGHSITVATRTSSGLPTSIIDSNGVEMALSYDLMGRLSSAQTAQQLSRYDYNESGQLTRIALPGRGAISYGYDSAGQLTTVSNSEGHRITYVLDAAGNRRSQTIRNQHGNVVFAHHSAFDELNRLREALDASNQTVLSYAYDTEGNRRHAIEPLGARTSKVYDALQRLRQITQRDLGTISYTYDNLDQLNTVTDPRGLVTAYEYDGLGNLLRLTSPDTGVTQFAYDSAGNMSQRIDARGVTTDFSYDALNRLQSVSYPNDPSLNITYSYDSTSEQNHGIGRLTRIDDGSGSTTIEYDPHGRVTSRQVALDEQSYQWSYRYHPSGQLASTISPSGYQVTFQHNDSGQLAAVSARGADDSSEQVLLEQITWYPFGPIKAWASGNQITTRFSRDQNYHLRTLDTTGLDPIMVRNYRYNALQDISHIEDGLNDHASQQFEYDPEHRLQAASGLYGDIRYRYDEVGNRLSRAMDSAANSEFASYHYSPTSNHLLSVNSDQHNPPSEQLMTYDANGNMVAMGQRTLSYNDANRMSDVTNGTTQQAMIYNALGQRVSVVQGSARRHFHYDLSGRLVAESDGNTGELSREYVYAAGQIIALVEHQPHYPEPEPEPEPENNNNKRPEPTRVTDARNHYRAIAAWLISRIQTFNATERRSDARPPITQGQRFFAATRPFVAFNTNSQCRQATCRARVPWRPVSTARRRR